MCYYIINVANKTEKDVDFGLGLYINIIHTGQTFKPTCIHVGLIINYKNSSMFDSE